MAPSRGTASIGDILKKHPEGSGNRSMLKKHPEGSGNRRFSNPWIPNTAAHRSHNTSTRIREFESRLLSSTPVESQTRDRTSPVSSPFRPRAVVNAANARPRPRAPGVQELLAGPPSDAKEWWAQQLNDGSRSPSRSMLQDSSETLDSYRAPATTLMNISRRAQSQVAWSGGKYPWWSKFFRGWRPDNHNTSVSTCGGSASTGLTAPSIELKHPAWKPVSSSPCPGYSTPSLPSNSPCSTRPPSPQSKRTSGNKKQVVAKSPVPPLQTCLKRSLTEEADTAEAAKDATQQQAGAGERQNGDIEVQDLEGFHAMDQLEKLEEGGTHAESVERSRRVMSGVNFDVEETEEKKGTMRQVRPPSPHFSIANAPSGFELPNYGVAFDAQGSDEEELDELRELEELHALEDLQEFGESTEEEPCTQDDVARTRGETRKSDHEAPPALRPATPARGIFSEDEDEKDDSSSVGTASSSTLEQQKTTPTAEGSSCVTATSSEQDSTSVAPRKSNIFSSSHPLRHHQAFQDPNPRARALRLRAWAVADRYIGGQQRVNEYRAQWRRKHDRLMLRKADRSRGHTGHVRGRRATAYMQGLNNLSALFSCARTGASTIPGVQPRYGKHSGKSSSTKSLEKLKSGSLSQTTLPEAGCDTIMEEEEPGQDKEGNGGEAEPLAPLPFPRRSLNLNTRFDNCVMEEADTLTDITPAATTPSTPSATPKVSRASTVINIAMGTLRGRQRTADLSHGADGAPAAEDGAAAGDTQASNFGSGGSRNSERERSVFLASAKGSRSLEKAAAAETPASGNTPRAPPVNASVDPILMARKYNFTVSEVKERFAEFQSLDRDKRGVLSRSEFLEAVKRRLCLKDTNEIPQRMIHEVWRATDSDRSGEIDFEEFLAWTQTVAFSEDLIVADPADKKIRELARRHNMPITTVEYIWREYDRCDCPEGMMNRECFTSLVELLLHAKEASDLPKGRLFTFWQAADTRRVGLIDFDQFLSWYIKYFVPMGSPSLGVESPASAVYAKLGSERFASYLSSLREPPQDECDLPSEKDLKDSPTDKNALRRSLGKTKDQKI